MSVVKKILSFSLTFIRKWWRPLAQLALVGMLWTLGVILPILTKTYPDLMGMSALVTSVVAAFAVRTYEKIKGSDDSST